MSISLKVELEIWAAALDAYDEQDFERALELFSGIADSSKILTNMALIYATVGEHEIAVKHFVAATNLDPYLAIAHFQCGVSNFLIERYDDALLNFGDAHLYLRGNEAINYEQIGLKFKLFSAEILFNRGLVQLNLGHTEQGMADMQEASRQKVTDEHGVIDEAIRNRGVGYTVFSIPVGVLYRPSENKIKNSKAKDFLGKAKLVAASDSDDAFTGFTGTRKLKQATEGMSDKSKIRSDENKSNAEILVASINLADLAFTSASSEPVIIHHTTLERSKTAPQRSPGVRPDATTILASRRAQSISNPANTSLLSQNNALSGRTNTTRVAPNSVTHTAIAPLRTKAPRGAAAANVGGTRAEGQTVMFASTSQTVLPNQPGPRRMQCPAPQSAPQLPPSIQPSQFVISMQDVTPSLLSAVPASKARGHLTQFYDTYMDVYTNEPALRSVPPGSPHPQERQPIPAWNSSSPSLASGSSHPNTSVPSRTTHAGINQNLGVNTEMNWNTSTQSQLRTGKDSGAAGSGTVRRKPARRPVVPRGTAYEVEEDDEGFVAGDYDTSEMANIRVKLHYQDDVRGMTIPPTSSFDEFVERVTVKFGTSLTGLGMKFMDEEGTKISLRDESDFELAIETARENAKGRSEGKIEVWCVDI